MRKTCANNFRTVVIECQLGQMRPLCTCRPATGNLLENIEQISGVNHRVGRFVRVPRRFRQATRSLTAGRTRTFRSQDRDAARAVNHRAGRFVRVPEECVTKRLSGGSGEKKTTPPDNSVRVE